MYPLVRSFRIPFCIPFRQTQRPRLSPFQVKGHADTAAMGKGTAMARRFEMTWFAPRRCWKKKKGGKVYYCPIACKGKTNDPDGYAASLAWWKGMEAGVAKAPPPAGLAALDKQDREWVKQLMTCPTNPRSQEDAMRVVERHRHPDFGKTQFVKWNEMAEEARKAKVPQDQTMEAMVKRFVGFKAAQAATGLKSAGRCINIRTYIEQFKAFFGADRPVSEITAVTLFDFHAKTLTDMGAGRLSSSAGRDRMQIAKQFIRWAWELGVLELPRNVESKELVIFVEAQEIEVFDFDTLKGILAGTPEPLKAYLALMANCGMTAMDVADLFHTEVDVTKGTITRIRSKRKRGKGKASNGGTAVKVTWQLWPMTLDLLLRNRNLKSDTVFTGSDGGKLAYTKLDPVTHKGCDVDLIAKAYRDHCRAANLPAADTKTLKCIRATSATKIGEHPEFGRYAQYFLGQSARSVAEKFYVKPSQDQFDRCLHWLGEQYGLIQPPAN